MERSILAAAIEKTIASSKSNQTVKKYERNLFEKVKTIILEAAHLPKHSASPRRSRYILHRFETISITNFIHRMPWLKHVLLDLAVSLALLMHATKSIPWLEVPLFIYTGLILVMKIPALFNRTLLRQMRKKDSAAPDWFYHLLYICNFVALLAAQYWIMGLLWLCVWLLSWLTAKKMQAWQETSTRKR